MVQRTQLKKLCIRQFRALRNVDIEPSAHVTVICGKNGTSKSSILGIAAQIFSFERDYTRDEKLSFETITGGNFKSLPAEHFRFSDRFDVPGSLDVSVELLDGYTQAPATAELELSKRGQSKARPVVRKNSSVATGNTSRNFTHPVIFLSLKRLLPIAARDYKVSNFNYLKQHERKFLNLTNELLNKTSSTATGTAGSIQSAVAHGASYDQDSVSAGEDNAGQIMLALMSFRKLKEEYPNYTGGLLLIDEADAGLFPAAQIALLSILNRECMELNLQVLMTSHSPTLIGYTHELSQSAPGRFKTIYLSDTYGAVQSMHDMSWAQISADLHTKTVSAGVDVALPVVNVYFEDREGYDLFNAVMFRQPAKKFIRLFDDVSLGCSNYIQLARRGVPEFSSKSIICLDADASALARGIDSIATLPGALPPDQLIFEYLYNLPANDPIWRNDLQFTRAVFTQVAREVLSTLSVPDAPIDLQELIKSSDRDTSTKKKLREVFKNFYNSTEFQRFLAQKKAAFNPWRCWVRDHQSAQQAFVDDFAKRLRRTMREAFGVDASKLVSLDGK
jgi:hypothetical protein